MKCVTNRLGIMISYVFNHRSYLDAVICYATVPNIASFIAMERLRRVPFINVWMIFLRCLFLNRSSLREGLKVIKAGVKLINVVIEYGNPIYIEYLCEEDKRLLGRYVQNTLVEMLKRNNQTT